MTTLILALQAPAGRPGGSTFLIIQFVLIIGIIYFFMVMPQQKQRRKHDALMKALKKGDDVVTVGGIIGRIVHIKEGMKDGSPNPGPTDQITIQSAESRLIVERGRIARVGSESTGAPAA